MLVLYKFVCFFVRNFYKTTLILILTFSVSNLGSSNYTDKTKTTTDHCEYNWMLHYLNYLDENAYIEEMVDFLINLRDSIIEKGYSVPFLSEQCLKLRNLLVNLNIEVNDDIIEEIYNEIVEREGIAINKSLFSSTSSTGCQFKILEIKKKKKDDLKIPGGVALGFMKFLGESLLCIIPHPVTISIGAILITNGIKDMISHAKDPLEDDIEDKMHNIPPPTQYQYINQLYINRPRRYVTQYL